MKITLTREYTEKEIMERAKQGMEIVPTHSSVYTIPESPVIPTMREMFTDMLMQIGFHPEAIETVIKHG